MIKTNELRRDNIVGASARQKNGEKFPGLSGFFRIDEIRGRSITATYLENGLIFSLFEDEAEGIPLTPELLERLGGEKTTAKFTTFIIYGDGDSHIEVEFYADLITAKAVYSGEYDSYPVGKPFKFLHELQNVYFALYREELDIKPLLK